MVEAQPKRTASIETEPLSIPSTGNARQHPPTDSIGYVAGPRGIPTPRELSVGRAGSQPVFSQLHPHRAAERLPVLEAHFRGLREGTSVCNHIHTCPFHLEPAAMSKRINVMIDKDTWGFLERVPAGERSRAINEALRAWVSRRRRNDAVREMEALRTRLPKISTDEVTRWIREERQHGH